MATINMLSSADMVKGQGVGSAYYEQVNLVSEGLGEKYRIYVNSSKKCDIIHFHTINPEYFVKLNLERKRSALVGYVHFLPETVDESLDLPREGKKLFYKYIIGFYKSMDYLVTVNPYFIKELEKYGIPKEKVTYIPNYVSSDMFYPYSKEKVQSLKRKWGVPEDKFVVLGVGQVQNRKGVMDFVEVAEKMPDLYFIWAGGFSFGPMTDGYKELKEVMLNPPENVIFTGIVEREQMNDIYNMADVMFLPSYNELFPMTILESMCVKKPILLRDLDIYHDILFDYYLRGNTNEDFEEVLQKLSQDGAFYKKWSEKSFEGHEFYSKENVLHLWEQFYDRVYSENYEKIMMNKKTSKKRRKAMKRDIKRAKKVMKKKAEVLEEMKVKKLSKKFFEEKDKLAEILKGEESNILGILNGLEKNAENEFLEKKKEEQEKKKQD